MPSKTPGPIWGGHARIRAPPRAQAAPTWCSSRRVCVGEARRASLAEKHDLSYMSLDTRRAASIALERKGIALERRRQQQKKRRSSMQHNPHTQMQRIKEVQLDPQVRPHASTATPVIYSFLIFYSGDILPVYSRNFQWLHIVNHFANVHCTCQNFKLSTSSVFRRTSSHFSSYIQTSALHGRIRWQKMLQRCMKPRAAHCCSVATATHCLSR